MATIVTRAGKGSPLTHNEVDANFNNLNTDKLESATAATTYAPIASPTFTGVVSVPLGSAAAPSLSITGDPNTGLYSLGADQVALSTAGTGRLFINAAGNVGIGDSSPSAQLTITGATGATHGIRLNAAGWSYINRIGVNGTSGGDFWVSQNYNAATNAVDSASYRSTSMRFTADSGTIEFGTGALNTVPTTRLFINNAGQVGIGHTSPAANARLHVKGTGIVNIVSEGTTDASFASLINGGLALYLHCATTQSEIRDMRDFPIVFMGNTTEYARFSSGRFLIGATNARENFYNSTINSQFLLESSGVSSGERIIANVHNSASASGPIVLLGKSRSASVAGNTLVVAEDSLGELSFQGNDATQFVEAASIKSFVDGSPGANDMPGRIVLATTADGAATPTEQLRITNRGTVVYNQPAPAAVDVTATLTVANLTAKIITSTTAAAVTMTLPTGTDMDAGFAGLYTNMAFEWSVINTGATNAVTVQGGTGHTIVGSGTVAASNSGRFVSRRTAATTWVSYRL